MTTPEIDPTVQFRTKLEELEAEVVKLREELRNSDVWKTAVALEVRGALDGRLQWAEHDLNHAVELLK